MCQNQLKHRAGHLQIGYLQLHGLHIAQRVYCITFNGLVLFFLCCKTFCWLKNVFTRGSTLIKELHSNYKNYLSRKDTFTRSRIKSCENHSEIAISKWFSKYVRQVCEWDPNIYLKILLEKDLYRKHVTNIINFPMEYLLRNVKEMLGQLSEC